MLSAGTYVARAKTAEFGKTSKGTEQVGVLFDLLDERDEPTGETITWFGFLTDKTYERTFEALRLMGWTGDDILQIDSISTNIVELVVEHEDYEGKTRARVQWINAPGSGGNIRMKDTLPEAERSSFAERMRGLARQADKNAGRVTAPTRVASPRPTPRRQAPAAAPPVTAPPADDSPEAQADDDFDPASLGGAA